VTISLSTRVKKSAHQVSSKLDGDIAILNLKSTLYFGLDNAGAVVWEFISEPRQVADICGAVESQFDVGEQQCQADVIELLTELEKAGLIEIEA
jgi:hypothetical protein